MLYGSRWHLVMGQEDNRCEQAEAYCRVGLGTARESHLARFATHAADEREHELGCYWRHLVYHVLNPWWGVCWQIWNIYE